MSVLNNAFGLLMTPDSTGYQIQRSLRFNSSDSAYLSRTPASAGNRKTWTWAGWVKRAKLGAAYEMFFSARAGTSSSRDYFAFQNDILALTCYNSAGTTITANIQTTAVFRDPGAWFHVVLAVDTTQSTAANRIKMYVNGVEITSFSLASYPAQNTDLSYNDTQPHTIGQGAAGTAFGFNGYLADIHFIDGQALTPSSFTEVSATTGQLIPKAYTGTFTGNSFWLKFADNSAATATTLGKDSSGLGNNWTPNNLSVTAGAGNDSLVDTPTSYGTGNSGGDVRGNFCTWSAVDKASNTTLSNGNLEVNTGGAANQGNVRGTFGMSSGKWYWEITPTSLTDGGSVGVQASSQKIDDYLSSTWVYVNDGTKSVNNTYPAYGASWTTGDVIGIALDCNAGTLVFYKNGASQGTAFNTGLAGVTLLPWLGDGNSGSSTGSAFTANFGQRPFAYTAPSGFKALCDTNLPAPVVAKPSSAFDVKLYTGNGSTQTISGLGFSPDLVWLKCRSAANTHALVDSVRGVTKYLVSAATDAEVTDSGGITSLNSDGFSLTFPTSTAPTINANNATYVGWCWDAGSSTVTNTQGSITSTVSVRANASAGFSVVTYTGTGVNCTVGHGLNVAPSLIIVKSRSVANDWAVYHAANTSDPKTDYLLLNSTAATADDNTYWNDTAPTSTVFSIGTNADVNTNGTTYVAYCWAPQVGYSSFGSYTGNGSATDGPFVYTGFRPKWILLKDASAGSTNWTLLDTSRDPYNVATNNLYPNLSNAENSGSNNVDVLSNGFKLKTATGGGVNTNGNTVIYAAFAESPFQYARAR